MAQKIKPTTLRLGITTDWQSRWFYKKKLSYFLEEDEFLRVTTMEKILQAGVDSIQIERVGDDVRLFIKAARPGIVIGRGGKGIEDLKAVLLKGIKKLRTRNKKNQKFSFNINVEELRRSEVSAPVLAQQIAFDIEKRIPYRSTMRRNLESLKQNKEVKGAKIKIGGRLNGAEISRVDQLMFGSMPLQTLRANIDYGEAASFNTYGTVGIKVWIYKGDIFKELKK